MSQRIPLLAAILAILVPAGASAQWRSGPRHRPHHRRPHVYQVAPGTRVVDLQNRRDIRRIGYLPPSVEVLNVAGTSVRELPNLPPRLARLNISHTAIQQVPYLPPSLRYFSARGSALRQVPYLPAGLMSLDVEGAPVQLVPNLPPSLLALDVSRTAVSQLPALPYGLRTLRAVGTRLQVAYIPPTVTTLEGVARPGRGWRRGGRRGWRHGHRDRRGPPPVVVRPRAGVLVQPANTYDPSWERYRRQRAR